MATRLCDGCGEPLVGSGRSDRRYHDGRCRKVAYRRRQSERATPEPAPSLTSGLLDREAVLEAATSEPRLLVYVARAAQTNWRAAAWLLERRFPQRWGSGHNGTNTTPPVDVFSEVDELAQRRRARRGD